jgi:hypothetical protein
MEIQPVPLMRLYVVSSCTDADTLVVSVPFLVAHDKDSVMNQSTSKYDNKLPL